MSQLRISQIAELGAASLEGPDGYVRAYNTIVRLSSLSEMEIIYSLGQIISDKLDSFNSISDSNINVEVCYLVYQLDEFYLHLF